MNQIRFKISAQKKRKMRTRTVMINKWNLSLKPRVKISNHQEVSLSLSAKEAVAAAVSQVVPPNLHQAAKSLHLLR